MKLLLVEDDVPLGRSLLQVLEQAGHTAVWVRSVAAAREHLRIELPEVVLLDIVLPDGSGLDLLARLRAQGFDRPVMMLTARDAVSDRVRGLDQGADDYLAKPFAMEEMLSRLRALQRRSRHHLSAVWQVGDLSIDTARRRITLAGDEVALSAREYDILVVLAAEPGKVLTSRDIDRACRLGDTVESNALQVHIYNLRRKIGAHRISTVRGVGYALESA